VFDSALGEGEGERGGWFFWFFLGGKQIVTKKQTGPLHFSKLIYWGGKETVKKGLEGRHL